MAWMVEMMKDLPQEIHLLKEGRTQEIRDNAPPLVNQERAQPKGRPTIEGEANPQYLNWLMLMPFLNKKGKSS